MPTKDILIVTRDVVFKTTLFFNEIDRYASELVIKKIIKLLKYLEMS
jgi:hypothetical protein